MVYKKTKMLELNLVASSPEADPDYNLVSCSVSNDGQGLFLFVHNDPTDEVHGRIERGASFAKTRMSGGKTFKLIIKNENQTKGVIIDNVDFTFPVFDVFSDGRVVIAGVRTKWRSKDDYDLNGLIFDPNSGERLSFLAGDGIDSLSIDNKYRIFISYFDEGVFGNNGWHNPGPPGPGAGGLCCFSDEGELEWQFNSVDGSGKFISDCYAMNVMGSCAYIYYYTDFLLGAIGGDFEKTFWRPHLNGCQSFAIDENFVLFSGQYDEPDTRFHLLQRLPKRLSNPIPVKVGLEIGKFTRANQTVCRGEYVHHFNQDGWFRASISDILDV